MVFNPHPPQSTQSTPTHHNPPKPSLTHPNSPQPTQLAPTYPTRPNIPNPPQPIRSLEQLPIPLALARSPPPPPIPAPSPLNIISCFCVFTKVWIILYLYPFPDEVKLNNIRYNLPKGFPRRESLQREICAIRNFHKSLSQMKLILKQAKASRSLLASWQPAKYITALICCWTSKKYFVLLHAENRMLNKGKFIFISAPIK